MFISMTRCSAFFFSSIEFVYRVHSHDINEAFEILVEIFNKIFTGVCFIRVRTTNYVSF
jgi:hypothetical protein